MMRVCSLAVIASLVAACGGSDGDASKNSALQPPLAGEGVQLELEIDVPAGVEGTWCRYFVLPDEARDIRRYESKYTPISHHLLLYQTTLTEAELPTTEVFECDEQDRFESVTGFHYGTQTHSDYVEFPDGFGKQQRPKEVVLMEYHAINATAGGVLANVRVNLWYTQEPIETLVETLFFYNPIIAIPPHGSAEASMHCQIDASVSILNLNHHMHRNGVGFEAWVIDGAGGELQALDISQSQHPETVRFDPPFELQNGDAIDFSCHYQNDGPTLVVEGDSAISNEMCVFAANYYSPPGEVVGIPTRLCDGVGSGVHMNGSQPCSPTLACLEATRELPPGSKKANSAAELCYAQACHSAYELSQAFLSCQYSHCQEECVDPLVVDALVCDPCVAQHCTAESQACSANACTN
jgi:hypothetical protein